MTLEEEALLAECVEIYPTINDVSKTVRFVLLKHKINNLNTQWILTLALEAKVADMKAEQKKEEEEIRFVGSAKSYQSRKDLFG